MVVSALIALMGVSSMAQAPQVPLFTFAAPDGQAGLAPVSHVFVVHRPNHRVRFFAKIA
jgi:hypothetical protein